MKRQILKLVFMLLALAPIPALADDGHSDGTSNGNYTNWRGAYAGAHVGGIFGDFVGNGATGPSGSGANVTPGLQGGYNFQTGPWVYGAEIDSSWTSIEGKSPALGHYQENWTSTARGRVGYAVRQFLPYLTVGLGVTNTDFAPPSGGERDDMQLGLAAGGGVEMMTPYKNTSVKLEYLHVDVPNDSNNIAGTTYNGGSSNNIITAGVNWHFD